MPVTLQVVDHQATGWTQEKTPDSEKLLAEACPKHSRRSKRLIQTSFTRRQFREGHISSSNNGFVWAAYHAYSYHHHLIIRPEDVWFAILTQLSFYINAHAEELRSFFVAHEGRKHLHLEVNELDFAYIAQEMTHLIAKNVIDPELRSWVMPSFSTTTDSDKAVGAILFMGAMQKYFSYGVGVCCGIPSVTLLGEVDDWKDILKRIDKIELLGEEPSQFARMIRPIVNHMILSFESPDSFQVIEFWNTIVHKVSLFSGTDYFTGWLTAFCFWDEDGKAKYISDNNQMFGGVAYPRVDVDKVPAGYASVPISVDDDGDAYEATMVAGSVGIIASSSRAVQERRANTDTDPLSSNQTATEEGQQQLEPDIVILDSIQPVSGWWICENEGHGEAEARETEKAQIEGQLKKIKTADLSNLSETMKLYRRLEELRAY